ncbi:MAG: discoidin domain-containing protein [Deltaproteobacteria bacterium]|nr:discoidin domain-containing protein [Deltaproteobacteria bacterium]MBF0525004.1 discoidin domain-containing protein [Deltaproteobacteria bacterium]
MKKKLTKIILYVITSALSIGLVVATVFAVDPGKNDIPLAEKLPLTAFSASSYYVNDSVYSPQHAKLSDTSAHSNWSAGELDQNQWLQVDLGKVREIVGVATKGRHANYLQWVTSYALSYSSDGKQWTFYKTKSDKDRTLFQGNQDTNTLVFHRFPKPIKARFVRIHPVTWHEHITMRLELYGSAKK